MAETDPFEILFHGHSPIVLVGFPGMQGAPGEKGDPGGISSSVVMAERNDAQIYSAANPDITVWVRTAPGEPGAMYLGGELILDLQAVSLPADLTYRLETEGGDVLVTEDGDLLVGEY